MSYFITSEKLYMVCHNCSALSAYVEGPKVGDTSGRLLSWSVSDSSSNGFLKFSKSRVRQSLNCIDMKIICLSCFGPRQAGGS